MMKRTSNKYSSRVSKQTAKRKSNIQLIEKLKNLILTPVLTSKTFSIDGNLAKWKVFQSIIANTREISYKRLSQRAAYTLQTYILQNPITLIN